MMKKATSKPAPSKAFVKEMQKMYPKGATISPAKKDAPAKTAKKK